MKEEGIWGHKDMENKLYKCIIIQYKFNRFTV